MIFFLLGKWKEEVFYEFAKLNQVEKKFHKCSFEAMHHCLVFL